MLSNFISVVICCYNSEKLIGNTLKYLATQETNSIFDYEVVLVDNNCNDDTVGIAKNVWNELKAKPRLIIVKEKKPGLSYARETGVKSCNGDIVVLCDDDNWLDTNYLKIAYTFLINNPSVAAVGGQSEGVLQGAIPPWWDKEKDNYAVGKQNIKSGDVTKRGYIWGAGMVFKKEIFIKLYRTNFESLLTDRKGTVLNSGGDSELCKWFILMGFKLWYLSDLKFQHYVPANRLSNSYLKKLTRGHLRAQPILAIYNRFIERFKYQEKYRITIPFRKKYLKRSVKAFLKNDKNWREDLQLALGLLFKLDYKVYRILKTYKRLNS